MDEDVEKTHRPLIDLSLDPIWIIGAGGRVDWVSAAVEQVLGYSREELEATNVLALVHPGDKEPLADHWRRMIEGEALGRRFLVRYRHAEGHWLTLEADGTVVSHGDEGTGVLVVTRGLAPAAELEEELWSVRREADQADKAWSEKVLSSIRHEMRTPLHAIMGFGQLLQQDDLSDDQRDCAEQILRAGRYLLELVDGTVGNPTDAVPDAAVVGPVALRTALEDTVAMIRPLAEARAIRLYDQTQETAVGAEVMADPGHLKQVLVNLLSNAVKYNRHAGSITVACQRVGGEKLRLSVTDTGPGIEAEAIERIFQPYERNGSHPCDVEGTGLGLAISMRLASAMGAALGVDSVLGTGTTFWIDMPVVAASPPEGKASWASPEASDR